MDWSDAKPAAVILLIAMVIVLGTNAVWPRASCSAAFAPAITQWEYATFTDGFVAGKRSTLWAEVGKTVQGASVDAIYAEMGGKPLANQERVGLADILTLVGRAGWELAISDKDENNIGYVMKRPVRSNSRNP